MAEDKMESAITVCSWHNLYNPTTAWLDGEMWNTKDPIPVGNKTHGDCPDCGEKAMAELKKMIKEKKK